MNRWDNDEIEAQDCAKQDELILPGGGIVNVAEIEEKGALSTQVGGDHYSRLKIQPAQYTHANDIGHMAGDAIAYITRYKFKNGRQDLEKAIHSLQLLIQMEYDE
ncbi:DUF3310 domain-containing protein [Methylobacter sp. Wu1]|uniref:DUF3310 domain-containing protein n=1 Tax=Methylobacter sp. Wu1 TaxID=3119359 RepID=UPI002F91FF0E